MRNIGKIGRMDDVFAAELEKRLAQNRVPDEEPPAEERLREYREEKDYNPVDASEEAYLEGDERSGREGRVEPRPYEALLREQEHKNSPNVGATGITEKRLDEASAEQYPHRNPKAWERTEEKRQVNALDEEAGDAGDASKQERYEKASKASQDQPPRAVDKNPGEQMDSDYPPIKAAYNRKKTKEAQVMNDCSAYLDYRNGHKFGLRGKLKEIRQIDDEMSGVMSLAANEGRLLTKPEQRRVIALKNRKSKLLGIR